MVTKSVLDNSNVRGITNKLKKENKLYGLLFVKLDRVGVRDSYVAAYGDIAKIHKYKNDFHLKGEVKEYKTQAWLVKRLESLKEKYDEDIKLLFVE